MIWLQIYLIGMSITFIAMVIAAIREGLLEGSPMLNIVIIFFSLVLWPIFDIILIIEMVKIYRSENKHDRF